MNILNALLEVTIYSSIVLVLVLAFKRLFRGRISPALQYGLWAIFMLRLLIPATIQSDISLIKLPAEQPPQLEVRNEQTFDFKTGGGDTQQQQQPKQPVQPNMQLENPAQNAQTNSNKSVLNISWGQVAMAVWIAGCIFMLAHFARQYIRLRKKALAGMLPPRRAFETLNNCRAQLGINSRVHLTCRFGLDTPALLFPNIIMLPAYMLEHGNEQLCMALMHELAHYKRKDHIIGMLLLALRCVYWFHPLLPIAHRLIREDMETACDAMVLRRLGPGRQKGYAQALLSMFSRQQNEACMLGMALGNTKRIAEKRIRGVFLPGRSKRTAKAVAVLMAMGIFVMCFTTACKPTPEKSAVIGKGSGMQDAVSNTSSQPDNSLYERVSAPQKWTVQQQGFFQGMDLVADAEITLPAAGKVPVALAVPREFTQQDVDMVSELMLGQDAKFNENVVITKEWIEKQLLESKKQLATETDDFWKGKLQGEIDAYQRDYSDAPFEDEIPAADKTLHEITFSDPSADVIPFEGIDVTSEMDGDMVNFTVSNGQYGYFTSMAIAGRDGHLASLGGDVLDEPIGVSITREQAGQQAQQLVDKIADDMQLCYVYPAARTSEYSKRNWGWACVFMRSVNGFPSSYTTEDVGMDMESTISSPIRYERITVGVDDEGILCFRWVSPMAVQSIENEDVQLLPFEEVSEIAIRQLGNKYAQFGDPADDKTGRVIKVTAVELGLMRIAKLDSSSYYYAPVWSFFSEYEESDALQKKYSKGEEPYIPELNDYVDENNEPLSFSDGPNSRYGSITINAIDGSIIDKDKGY